MNKKKLIKDLNKNSNKLEQKLLTNLRKSSITIEDKHNIYNNIMTELIEKDEVNTSLFQNIIKLHNNIYNDI